jgi:diguanylate cyclase (GGDEF)-like protein
MRLAANPIVIAVTITLAYISAFGLLLLFRPFGEDGFVAVEDAAGTLPPLAAGMISLLSSRRSLGRGRTGWLLIGLACSAWGAGEAIWMYYEVALGTETPFPSLADAAYLGSVPFFFAGVIVLTAPARKGTWLRLGLEALAFVAAAAAVSWHFVIGPIYEDAAATVLEKTLSAAYPLGDLALIFAFFLALPGLKRDRAGAVLGCFTAGLACFLIADSTFAYEEINGTYSAGDPLDLAWVAGTTLFALAGWLQYVWRPAYGDWSDRLTTSVWYQILPLAMLPPIVAWPLLSQAVGFESAPDDTPTILFILAYAALITARHGLGLLDTLRLNRRLTAMNLSLRARAEVLSERLVAEQTASSRDALTGLLSRRAILQELDRLLGSRAANLAVGMVDADNLKRVNDDHGHTAGDELLREIAQGLTIEGAIVGRLGGDEFLVLLPGAGENEADAYMSLVEWRLRTETAMGVLPACTAGFAFYPADAQGRTAILEVADGRMYEAKRQKKARGHAA